VTAHVAPRRLALVALAVAATLALAPRAAPDPPGTGPWTAAGGILVEGATVVTMDDRHDVIHDGSVLVRGGRIVAVWSGPHAPRGVDPSGASVVRAGPDDLLLPSFVDIHDHPFYDAVDTWLPPSSDAIQSVGKTGSQPYDNRYEWGAAGSSTVTAEHRRLVVNPANVLGTSLGLGLDPELNKYTQAAALLGGETALMGGEGTLIRGVDQGGFDSRIAPEYTGSIDAIPADVLSSVQDGMAAGNYDAWVIHLAEGVRDGYRRPGDTVSSRAEFATLKADGLLTDETVIIHGTALERSDFAAMRTAASPRTDGTGDGLGAKLVWSPLSNLLLYGRTTNVYDALAEHVLVSLGTDWTASGSRTLLNELKVADIALRDPRVLGSSRHGFPGRALDRELVDMVTRNPARTLRWYDRVGSVEAGKVADLLLLHVPSPAWRPPGDPPSVYRDVIDAGERDVELVLLGGDPLAGDVGLMAALKPGGAEVVASPAGGFEKAIDATSTATGPAAGETVAQLESVLQAGLTALGGDHLPAGGGPGPPNNTYGYLKAHVAGGAAAGYPNAVFRGLLAQNVGVLPDGSLNIEAMRLEPLFEDDDALLLHVLHGDVEPSTGLVADPDPPYRLYPANLNQIGPFGNPFAEFPRMAP
jgi:cytosine/adenosine deaminase-related metal-dependent hydrolase